VGAAAKAANGASGVPSGKRPTGVSVTAAATKAIETTKAIDRKAQERDAMRTRWRENKTAPVESVDALMAQLMAAAAVEVNASNASSVW
jgi:hypothetical protein